MVSCPPLRLLVVGWTVTALCLFSVGYQYSAMNVAHDVFLSFINNSYIEHYGIRPTKTRLSTMWSICVSLWQAGAMVGCLLSFFAEEKFGRKITMLIIGGGMQILGSLAMAASPVVNSFELLAAGRFVAGISAGLISPTLRVYLCEISPDQYRGIMNSFGGLVLSLGALVGLVLGQPFALGTMDMLPYLLGLCFVPSTIQFLINPFIPKTPKYLYIHEANHAEAVRSLHFYYGHDVQVTKEFREFEREKRITDEELPLCRALRTRAIAMPLVLSFLLGWTNSSLGVDIIDSYSTEIFVQFGMAEQVAKRSSILFNVPGMVGGILATAFVVNSCGRRPLLLWTLLLSFLCNCSFLAFGLYSHYQGYTVAVGYGTVFTSCLLAFIYGIGPGAIVEFVFAEITPQIVRSAAGSISEFSFWSTNVVYVMLFPPLINLIGPYVFLVHTIPLLLCTIVFYFKLPETSNRSVMDIVADMEAEPDEDEDIQGGSSSHNRDNRSKRTMRSKNDSVEDYEPLLKGNESSGFMSNYGSLNEQDSGGSCSA